MQQSQNMKSFREEFEKHSRTHSFSNHRRRTSLRKPGELDPPKIFRFKAILSTLGSRVTQSPLYLLLR